VDVVRLFGQLPNSLEGDAGVVLPAEAAPGAKLNLTAAAVALCFLKNEFQFTFEFFYMVVKNIVSI
jgi:hypothetical protein